jgi:hypothetical protein
MRPTPPGDGSASRCPRTTAGQGLPYTLNVVMNEFASAANMAFAMYPA